jgi:hypothetical protein
MEARALEQPPSDHGGLMRPIVVKDRMHIQLSCNVLSRGGP